MEKAITQEYWQDFYSWLMTNAQLLRQGRLSEIDVEHLAEELESMGRSEKRALISRLTILLVHLLKWQFQPARRSKSWRNTLTVQRSDVLDLLEDSPSLRYELEQHIEKAYEKAKLIAEDETGIEKAHFPQRCPYSFEQIVDQEFFPEQEEPSTA